MKKIYQLALTAVVALLILTSCEEEPDMAFDRVASPVLLVTDPVGTDDIQATFYELDKSGILDQNIGIDSIPIPNLSIEVFSSNASLGTFTTDASGAITVQDLGDLAWVGEYKGVKFRFQ
ncbi:MAG: hypothetical protein AAGE93_15175 [Bacteroidota bacterium]